MEAVNDVFSLDFKITIYSADVDYYLCFHHGRLVGKVSFTQLLLSLKVKSKTLKVLEVSMIIIDKIHI